MAPSHAHMHAGPLLSLAPEDQVGEKKHRRLLCRSLRFLLNVLLPFRVFDLALTIELVSWIQLKNHRAYLSHRKRKEMIFNSS